MISEAAGNMIVTILKKIFCTLDSAELGGTLVSQMIVPFVSLDRAGIA
jgi:hypothetical protein